MKKILCILFSLVLLVGCSQTPEVTEPAATEPQLTATEAEPTEAPWAPYTGTSKGYVYYHKEERDRNWEEDILYFGDNYLDNFHSLTRFPSRIELIDHVEYSDEFYNPELRQQFLDRINALIPRIPELTDTEILFELQSILVLLGDAHTAIDVPADNVFPIGFEVFYENKKPVYRVASITTEYDNAIMATLDGINGYSAEEAIELMLPYISRENQHCVSSALSGNGYPGFFSCKEYLQISGIMDADEDTVYYSLTSVLGYKLKIEFEASTLADLKELDLTGFTHEMVYPSIYADTETQYYHYQVLPDDDMVYVRFNEFTPMWDYPILNLGNDLLREVRDMGGAKKLVVDLRRNPGGSQTLGFPEFITVLQRLDVGQIYVLIDHGTFSCAVIMASRIKECIPDALLVGTPAGQPPNFFAGIYDGDYVMPNSNTTCWIPTAYYRMMPGYEYDALMPDITVYPALEDYAYGIDTILEAVKAH